MKPVVPAISRPAGSHDPSLKRLTSECQEFDRPGVRSIHGLGSVELVGGKGRDDSGMRTIVFAEVAMS